MQRGGCIYMLTNRHKTTLYIGVTSDLIRRVQEHKNRHKPDSFSARYHLVHLVYYELFSTIQEAILREKQVKKWSRAKKEVLIHTVNPQWFDLWDTEVRFW